MHVNTYLEQRVCILHIVTTTQQDVKCLDIKLVYNI